VVNFHVGQKVVCVDDERRPYGSRVPRYKGEACGAKFPKKGSIYTIREVYISNKGTPGVILGEIDNFEASIALGFNKEIGFDADRFRPVTTHKTDISIFTDMLKTKRVGVDA
jgi:hypothetical protein